MYENWSAFILKIMSNKKNKTYVKKVKIEKSHELAGEKKKGERHYEFWAGEKIIFASEEKVGKDIN